MKSLCILWFLLLPGWIHAQSNPHEAKSKSEPKACNANVTFCWYGSDSPFGEEVTAWGNRWVNRGVKASSVESIVEIRCIKALMLCIDAGNSVDHNGKRVTSIDIYHIVSWGTANIEARPEGDNACLEIKLQMNKIEQTATKIFRPKDSVEAQFAHFCSESPQEFKTMTEILMQ